MTVLAVVGATGSVGRAMLEILGERGFPADEVRVMASARSAGAKLETAWGRLEVEDLDLADPAGLDLALFSAGADRSRRHAARFQEAGAVIVDNSSAFRMDPDVPLVVTGVNEHALEGHRGIIANPNCTTMELVLALAPLHRHAGLTQVVASSYQAVSGTGRRGVDELLEQAEKLGSDPEALMSGSWKDPGPEVYRRPIGWNVVPFAGEEGRGGYTDEEWKFVNESRKILDLPELAVEVTCVRVPVLVGHAVAVSAWFERPLEAKEAFGLLDGADGIELWRDEIPTPLDAAGRDPVLVGRVRPTLGRPGGITLWVVADNLRKGAALNAVQIAESLVSPGGSAQ